MLVEVTMATGRTQTMMEVWPIERHLDDFQRERKAQCIFVAPSIFSDSQRQIEFVAFQSRGQKRIRAFAINDLVVFLEQSPSLYDYSPPHLPYHYEPFEAESSQWMMVAEPEGEDNRTNQ